MDKTLNLIIRVSLTLALLIILGGLGIFWLFYLEEYSYRLEGYFYLWLLVALIYALWGFKLKTQTILLYGLLIYAVGAFSATLNFIPFAEIVIRTSFTLFIVGIANAFLEYRKTVK